MQEKESSAVMCLHKELLRNIPSHTYVMNIVSGIFQRPQINYDWIFICVPENELICIS